MKTKIRKSLKLNVIAALFSIVMAVSSLISASIYGEGYGGKALIWRTLEFPCIVPYYLFQMISFDILPFMSYEPSIIFCFASALIVWYLIFCTIFFIFKKIGKAKNK